jgi:hypothetical protein
MMHGRKPKVVVACSVIAVIVLSTITAAAVGGPDGPTAPTRVGPETAASADSADDARIIPADQGVDQTSTTVDDVISTTTPDILVSASVSLAAAHNHGCIVTASAEVSRTSDATGVYVFGISLDSVVATSTASDRRIEFVSTTDLDSIWISVSSTMGFDNLTGSHTFYWSARKDSAGYADTTVTNSSIIVDCQKGQL